MKRAALWRVVLIAFTAGAMAFLAVGIGLGVAPLFESGARAQTEGSVPGNALGTLSDSEVWRAVRRGVSGTVSIPDEKAAVLVQSEGDNWRAWRNGPIAWVGGIAFWVMFFVVFGFYQLRGKVRIKSGRSGRRVLRFGFVERFAHWLTAGSFIVLAITGVNLLYGRYVVRFLDALFGAGPGEIGLSGSETFATLTLYGKYVHNYVAFAFMLGLLMIIVLWVRENIWDRYDWNWIKKGGGLLFPTEHPPAGKFNFGQKTMFWGVVIFGGVLSLTGLNLLFPFVLTASVEQMQWIQAIHATFSQIICMLMVAHIYIGTVGMEDAFNAMKTGYVDENWAKEHHSAWYQQKLRDEREAAGGAGQAPAVAPAE